MQDPQASCDVKGSIHAHACDVEKLLGVMQRCNQSHGNQLKPPARIIDALEKCHAEGSIEALKFIGFGYETDTCFYFDICFYFKMPVKIHNSELTHTQASTKKSQLFRMV